MNGIYENAGENLVRHANGTYYLRAKVGGKCIYKSLKVKDLRIAKIKRNDALAKIRSESLAIRTSSVKSTLGHALEMLRIELCDRSHIAEKTRQYGAATVEILRRKLPTQAHGKTWSDAEAADCWENIAGEYSPSVANKVLSALHRLAQILIESGMRTDNPTAKLARMPSRKAHLSMPSLDQMEGIIAHVIMQKKRLCVESSRMIAVLAFSGMRHGESLQLRWADVDQEWIIVAREGKNKTRRSRRVPINNHLRRALDAIREDSDGPMVLSIHSPRRALKTACLALGVAPMRVHDLRHFFATWCIESGVDIPTVAKWLGHQDGGALAMRTYGHVRDDHSLQSVKKLGMPTTPGTGCVSE